MERVKQKEADRQREIEEREEKRRNFEEQSLLDINDTPSSSHIKSKFVRQIIPFILLLYIIDISIIRMQFNNPKNQKIFASVTKSLQFEYLPICCHQNTSNWNRFICT